MIKLIFIFLIGLIETFVNVAFLISVNKKQVWISTILEFVYSIIYLFVVAYALRADDTFSILIAYAVGCSAGTYIRMKREQNND
jgi:uncharacterized protein YebE (UPF0316 family)